MPTPFAPHIDVAGPSTYSYGFGKSEQDLWSEYSRRLSETQRSAAEQSASDQARITLKYQQMYGGAGAGGGGGEGGGSAMPTNRNRNSGGGGKPKGSTRDPRFLAALADLAQEHPELGTVYDPVTGEIKIDEKALEKTRQKSLKSEADKEADIADERQSKKLMRQLAQQAAGEEVRTQEAQTREIGTRTSDTHFAHATEQEFYQRHRGSILQGDELDLRMKELGLDEAGKDAFMAVEERQNKLSEQRAHLRAAVSGANIAALDEKFKTLTFDLDVDHAVATGRIDKLKEGAADVDLVSSKLQQKRQELELKRSTEGLYDDKRKQIIDAQLDQLRVQEQRLRNKGIEIVNGTYQVAQDEAKDKLKRLQEGVAAEDFDKVAGVGVDALHMLSGMAAERVKAVNETYMPMMTLANEKIQSAIAGEADPEVIAGLKDNLRELMGDYQKALSSDIMKYAEDTAVDLTEGIMKHAGLARPMPEPTPDEEAREYLDMFGSPEETIKKVQEMRSKMVGPGLEQDAAQLDKVLEILGAGGAGEAAPGDQPGLPGLGGTGTETGTEDGMPFAPPPPKKPAGQARQEAQDDKYSAGGVPAAAPQVTAKTAVRPAVHPGQQPEAVAEAKPTVGSGQKVSGNMLATINQRIKEARARGATPDQLLQIVNELLSNPQMLQATGVK